MNGLGGPVAGAVTSGAISTALGYTPSAPVPASSPTQTGTMSAAQASQLTAQATQLAALPATFAGGFLVMSMTLTSGAKTTASGKNLSAATIVSVTLVSANASAALGAQIAASISGNSVVLASLSAVNLAVPTDTGTYQVVIIGWT